jgi:sucrose-6-phosphate hydrolase SacC (GH32 family)
LNNNILEDLNGLCLEIICKFDSFGESESFGLKIIDKADNNKNFDIKYQKKTRKMVVGEEEGFINLNNENNEFLLHLFIDKSVIEAYINYNDAITSRYYPKTIDDIKIAFFSDLKPITLESIEVWKLDKITYKF